MGLLPDAQNCGLRMHREYRERFPRHRLQRNPLVSDPSMHHGTCVTLTCGGGDNDPGIPGVCATRNLTYLVRGPWYLIFKWVALTMIMGIVLQPVTHQKCPTSVITGHVMWTCLRFISTPIFYVFSTCALQTFHNDLSIVRRQLSKRCWTKLWIFQRKCIDLLMLNNWGLILEACFPSITMRWNITVS